MDNPVAGGGGPRPVRCSGRSGESILWAALFIAVLFLGGAQLVLIGILGEYLGRISGEAKPRPLHVVKERLGFPSPVAQIRRHPGLFLPAVGHLSGHAFRSFHERLPGRFLAGRCWPNALSRQSAHLTAALGIVRSTPRTLALLALSAHSGQADHQSERSDAGR